LGSIVFPVTRDYQKVPEGAWHFNSLTK